jgi:hypothetical protein
LKRLIIYTALFTCLFACKKHESYPQLSNKDIAKVLDQMTKLMIHDVTNPPLAARFYSYACISGYTVLSFNDKKVLPLKGLLNEFPDIKRPLDSGEYSPQLSAILAMSGTAKKMQPTGRLFNDFEKLFLDSCRKIGFSDDIIARSQSYANQVVKQVMAYVKADRYNRISNYPRYTPLGEEGSWYPTPPAFFAPVEPYFQTIRTFMIDSCSQFKPARPTPFSKDKNSAFFKMMKANYIDGGKGLTPEHRVIAGFWDCNPFAIKNEGHLMVGMKKISPGAHWLGITGIACQQSKLNFSKSMEIYSMVAFGLTDSFIGCWDEKYRSNRIRPETAIRKLIDPNWKPMLQTPPFPEYPSGHSCISATSSIILTYYFGPDYKFTDSVEETYGLTPRNFTSFKQAAAEAAMSRYWGGIHFMDAATNGITLGQGVGNFIVTKLKDCKVAPVM